MDKFGELISLGLNSEWGKEIEFSQWLADNIQTVGDKLGMDIEFLEKEASVGDFSLDILAKDLGTGKNVVIENQYGKTDHDHMGKLLVYAAGFEASTVIWITEEIRDEYRQTLEWLNQRTDTDTQFFGIVAEVLQIGDSKKAFNLKLVVFPNEWQKSRRQSTQKIPSLRSEAYREFFQQLMDELRDKHSFTQAKKGQPQNWYYFATGFSDIRYSTSFTKDKQIRVALLMNASDSVVNKNLFDWLANNRETIAEKFGSPLEWERLDENVYSKIAIYKPGSIDDDEETLHDIRTWVVNSLVEFKRVFSPWLKKYYKDVK